MYTILRHTPAHKCRDFDNDRSPVDENLGQRMLGTPPVSYTISSLHTHTNPLLDSWSATTGRPSILPGSYLSQCRNLLNFEQTTMRDAMLFAEVSLYCTLQQDTCGMPNFASDGDCEKFAPWKQKWGYLLGE